MVIFRIKIASFQHDYWPISNGNAVKHINWVAYGILFKLLYIHTKTKLTKSTILWCFGWLKFQEFVNSTSTRQIRLLKKLLQNQFMQLLSGIEFILKWNTEMKFDLH